MIFYENKVFQYFSILFQQQQIKLIKKYADNFFLLIQLLFVHVNSALDAISSGCKYSYYNKISRAIPTELLPYTGNKHGQFSTLYCCCERSIFGSFTTTQQNDKNCLFVLPVLAMGMKLCTWSIRVLLEKVLSL